MSHVTLVDGPKQAVIFPVGIPFPEETVYKGKDATRKILEEAAELSVAANDYLKDKDTREHVLEELADTYQTLVCLAYSFGFTDEEIVQSYDKVCAHNEERGRYNG